MPKASRWAKQVRTLFCHKEFHTRGVRHAERRDGSCRIDQAHALAESAPTGPTLPEARPNHGAANDMQVFVKSVGGKTWVLDFFSSASIAEVKAAVERRDGTPIQAQRVQTLLGENLREDDRSLGDYGVCDGATLVILLKLRGGAEHFQPYRAPSSEPDAVGGRSATDSGDWNVFYLELHNIDFEAHRDRCPVTCEVLESVARTYGHAFFSSTAASTHITPHNGPTVKHSAEINQ